jgi:hypothetical protein
MTCVLFLLLLAVPAEAATETSWLADDVTDTYHKGTLAYLNDPLGRGLSVYDNPVVRVNGTFFRSGWKAAYPSMPTSFKYSGLEISPGWSFESYQMTVPPAYVYLGLQPVPYTEYVSFPYYGETNHLWIEEQNSWTRRTLAPWGTEVTMLAYTQKSGQAEVYKIYPDSTVSVDTVPIPAGYSHMGFLASAQGRHLISFVKDNQPSETVIIDVMGTGGLQK